MARFLVLVIAVYCLLAAAGYLLGLVVSPSLGGAVTAVVALALGMYLYRLARWPPERPVARRPHLAGPIDRPRSKTQRTQNDGGRIRPCGR